MTGALSFTGFHIVNALAAQGALVYATATRPADSYESLPKMRLQGLAEQVCLLDNMPFGTESFIAAILKTRPDVLIHHGANTTGYRSREFDVGAAVENNCFGLQDTIDAFSAAGGRHVWVSGSIFQGDGNEIPPISPYGESKATTAALFLEAARSKSLHYSDLIIPNPFGPMDNAKLCDYLFDQWSRQQVATINTPNWVRDNIFVDLLAQAYAQSVLRERRGRVALSGTHSSMLSFSEKVALETRLRTGWDCRLECRARNEDSQPAVLVNPDKAIDRVPFWSETKAWDALIRWQVERLSL